MEQQPGELGHDRDERGFTLLEHIIAMTLVFGTLLVLLGALGSAANGISNGRQRTIATSLGKQSVETLQGSSYSDVTMNLASTGLPTDPRIAGLAPSLTFEGETLVGGGAGQYRVTTLVGGVQYVVSTYITAVTPASGTAYRRITVIVEWTPSTSGDVHSLRFSSLVFPLDYGSYPASSGLAEVDGASFSLSGSFGDEDIDELLIELPGAQTTATASTLRTAQATSSGAMAVLDTADGELASLDCTLSGSGPDRAECAVSTFDAVSDNDAGSTAATAAGTTNASYPSSALSSDEGISLEVPSGTASARTYVQACAACSYGDADDEPWADASSTTSSALSFTFDESSGTGAMSGTLLGIAGGWSAAASLDEDTTGGGTLAAAASLGSPAVVLFDVDDAGVFDGAVRIPAFVASATATAGYTATGPSTSTASIDVQLWDDLVAGYRTVSVGAGATVDETATATVLVGADTVTVTSRILSQPATTSTAGTSPRSAVGAQHSSIMVVTIDVVVVGPHAAAFTMVFDYGRITAQAEWLVAP